MSGRLATARVVPRALLVLLALAGAPRAEAIPAELTAGAGLVVAEVVDGDTVVLENGDHLRLVGIMAPKLSLGRDWFEDQPLARAARRHLAALVRGRSVTPAFGGARRDRHGRLLAHLFLEDGGWVQGRMLEAGLARVYSFSDNRAVVPAMLALEDKARRAGLGIWSHAFYAPRDAARPATVPLDRFEIVEGRVVEAAEVNGRVYLNFGEDWRRDVTATIAPGDRAPFRRAAMDPLDLEGRLVRIRGWTGWYNGPNIELDHPEQIEIVR